MKIWEGRTVEDLYGMINDLQNENSSLKNDLRIVEQDYEYRIEKLEREIDFLNYEIVELRSDRR